MGSYLINKSIFNWYLPQSSLFYWFFPVIFLLVFDSSFLRRFMRASIFNLLSLWYFPLESCRSIYQSICSSLLSSVASCLLFISPIFTNQDYIQPFLSVTFGLLGPFYPVLLASSSIRFGSSGIWYLAGMLNLGFKILRLGSSLTWSSCQNYQPSPNFTIPGSLVIETSPSCLFLLTHTIRLNQWFCRLYGFFGPLLYELYVRQRLSYNFASHYLRVIYEFLLRPPKKPPDAFDSLSRNYASCSGWECPLRVPFRTYRTTPVTPRKKISSAVAYTTICEFTDTVDMLQMNILLSDPSSIKSPPEVDWDSPSPSSFHDRVLASDENEIGNFTQSSTQSFSIVSFMTSTYQFVRLTAKPLLHLHVSMINW